MRHHMIMTQEAPRIAGAIAVKVTQSRGAKFITKAAHPAMITTRTQ